MKKACPGCDYGVHCEAAAGNVELALKLPHQQKPVTRKRILQQRCTSVKQAVVERQAVAHIIEITHISKHLSVYKSLLFHDVIFYHFTFCSISTLFSVKCIEAYDTAL